MGFADSIKKIETADNRPIFRRLLELLEALPHELESLVDKPRLVRFAREAVKNDLRGEVVNYSVSENIDRLESLVEWLSTDVVA
jgi:hypothetical protein